MIPAGRISRLRTGVPLLLLAFLSLSCGSGGTDFAGGGTGGTGISTGTITGFGSVVVNGVHFRTDGSVAPGFTTKKLYNGADHSGRADKDVFAVGMVVTLRHGAGGSNASEIEYRDNLQGPVAARKVSGTDNVIEVLGQTVVVDDAAIFSSLKGNDVVSVSGFADTAGRIRAASVLPVSPSIKEFKACGFASGWSPSDAVFRLGPLPDGSGAGVTVSYDPAAVTGLPGWLANGMYVEVVTTDREPVGGIITAIRIGKVTARTEFPDGTPVVLEGLVTTPWNGSGDDLSFAVEGKRVRRDAGTEWVGGTADDLRRADSKVQVQGTETGGALAAAKIVFR